MGIATIESTAAPTESSSDIATTNTGEKKHLRIVPLTLKQANQLIAQLHRHHQPVRGHRFSIGCMLGSQLVGACVVGRPVARMTDQYTVAEVTRLVTDGTKNACSVLYAA